MDSTIFGPDEPTFRDMSDMSGLFQEMVLAELEKERRRQQGFPSDEFTYTIAACNLDLVFPDRGGRP